MPPRCATSLQKLAQRSGMKKTSHKRNNQASVLTHGVIRCHATAQKSGDCWISARNLVLQIGCRKDKQRRLQGACTYTGFVQEKVTFAAWELSEWDVVKQNWFSIQQKPSRKIAGRGLRHASKSLKNACYREVECDEGTHRYSSRTAKAPHKRVRDAIEWLTDY